MADFLFLQRFSAGDVERMPFDKIVGFLGQFGDARPVAGGVEVGVDGDELGQALFVVGDAGTGASCVAVLGPRYGESLRHLVWRCMAEFGCVAFDDTLSRMFIPANAGDGAVEALPAALRDAADTVLRRISGPGQLWPAWSDMHMDGPARYAMVRGAPDGLPPVIQLFDHIEPERKLLQLSFAMAVPACNAGTLGALQMLRSRVGHVLDANPGYGIAYRYEDPHTALQHMEAPAQANAATHPATIISPFPLERLRSIPFASDRELFASFSEQGRLAEQAVRDDFGAALDGSAQSVKVLAHILDKLHLSVRGGDAQEDIAQWSIRAGSYLALVLCRQVGGQLGYTTRNAIRIPCVRMHSGRLQFPLMRVLDHICNGESDDIGAWFDAVARADASRIARQEDWVCNIAGYCDILLGRADLAGGGKLPLEHEIPRERLDFSIESLEALDAYLAKIRALPARERQRVLGQVAVTAGAYLGEVIRSRARDEWIWVPYDDHAAANPGFSEQRPRQSTLLAILDSHDNSCYPIAQVAGQIEGTVTTDCRAFAKAVAPAASVGETPVAAHDPADDGDPAFCPNCSHPMLDTATACERCGAQFAADANWKPLAQLPPAAPPAKAAGASPSAAPAPSALARWLLRAGHVCLLGPILHFAAASAMGKAPIDAIGRLWLLVPFFYAAGGLVAWHARRQAKQAAQAQAGGTLADSFVAGPWDMDAYENLPVGIRVTHDPAKGPAIRNGPSGHAFSWVCKTSVAALGEPVQVKAFCGTVWQDGRWVPVNVSSKPFDASQFEQWYGCEQAWLLPGHAYSDDSNWTGAGALRRSMTRWCYVGLTDGGRVVRGDATVHHSAALA